MGADVIVIGAGYGGLTAAAGLAKKGLQVQLLEETGHLGGRAAFDRKDGFQVDYGIHANRYAGEGPAAAALREIGHEIDFVSMGEPQLYRDGSFVPLPTGVPEFLKAEFLSGADKMVMIADMLRLVLPSPRDRQDIPLRDAVWGARRQEIGSLLRLLSGIGLVSPDIDTTSAAQFATFLKRALRAQENVAYPRGGTSQIVEALSARIEEGGEILTNSRVKSISINGGKVKSVTVKEDELTAKAYVFAVPLQKLAGLVDSGLPADFMEKCSGIVPTAGISIDLCLNQTVSDIDGLVVTPDPVTMGQFTSNIDPTTAPEGKQLATFYYPLPVEMMDDRDAVDREQARLRELLSKMFPGILKVVAWERVLRLKMVDGFRPSVGQTEKDRPGVVAPGVENLFFAGDVVSAPYSGGDVAFATGSEAAGAVASYLR
jgi:phytoene dehydrogenase-like protein